MSLASWAASDGSAAFAVGDSIIPAESIERLPAPLGTTARVLSGVGTTAERDTWLGWTIRTGLLPIADIETAEGLLLAAGSVTVNGADFATDVDAQVMACDREESTEAFDHARLMIELHEIDPL